jgi:CRISPR-associated protein Csm4
MKLITLKITPKSNFVTPPKGDTLFGQIVSLLYQDGCNIFDGYLDNDPKFIVSDMMPYDYVYKPNLPLAYFNTEDKKEIRKRGFIKLTDLQKGNLSLDSCKKVDYFDEVISVKNSINRRTFTTDDENFAPYGTIEREIKKYMWIFILVQEDIEKQIIETIKRVGMYGFGKEANIGKGQFEINQIDNPFDFNVDTKYFMSISPTILKDTNIQNSWYEPFTRFGKYGLNNAHSNAFKKPTLMADSAAVVQLKKPKKYFGSCNDNGIKNKPSFVQGYSISIPVGLKDI